ncbi:MAG: hypothetical protein H0W99_05470, partial [Acidobacteria bacterium]|nr:hypothetical protein [Acidobacteriota bacterium]
MSRRKSAVSIILAGVLIAGLFTGCASSKKEAQALVKAGSATSEQLADYYDSLIQKQTDYLTIASYTVGLTFSVEEKKQLVKERKAYASRADLARKLKAAYDALGKLIDYDAAGEVKGAVGDLLTAVLKQVDHPKQLDSDLFKTVVGKIAGKLVEIQQEKQFRKNVPRVLEVLDGVGEIFEMERDIYAQTAKLYEDEAARLAKRMVGTDMPGTDQATGMGMLKKYIEPYGLELYLTTVTDPDTRRKNLEFSNARIDEQSKERKVAAQNQARNTSISLYNLVRMNRIFLGGKATAPLLIEANITDTNKLVTALSEALAARERWEKQETERKKADENYEVKPFEPAQDSAVSDYVATLLSPAVKEMLKAGGNQTASGAFRRQLTEDLNR